MPRRAFQFYQRKRVVNINLNIFVAGLIAIAIAKYPVLLISNFVGHEHKLLISVLAYIVDTSIDIFIYFGLHWIANHWRPNQSPPLEESPTITTDPKIGDSKTKKFLIDAGRVQAERFALVPIFAIIAMGGMWAIQHLTTIKPDWAFVFSFIFAMLCTRVIHTIWGYRSGTFRDNIPDEPAYIVPPDAQGTPRDTN
jgi:hypothetical protein